MKKRLWALILTLILVTGMIPLQVQAASLTTSDVQSLIDTARGALGKTRAQLGLPNDAWCGYFAGYCVNNSAIGQKVGNVGTSDCCFSISIAKWGMKKGVGVYYSCSPYHTGRLSDVEYTGRLVSVDRAGFEPRPGDIIQFSWDGTYFSHVGIVTGVNGSDVTYIDGNSGSSGGTTNTRVVMEHTMSRTSTSIIGYFRFDSDGAEPDPVPEVKLLDIAPGVYTIHSAKDDNKVLDIERDSKENRANIQLYEVLNNDVQKFRIEKVGDYYTIQSVYSGLWLDVALPIGLRSNVQLFNSKENPEEKWQFEDAGNGYVYVRNYYGYYLDLAKNSTANKTNVQLYYKESDVQKWRLELVDTRPPVGTTSKPDVTVDGQNVTVSWDYSGSGSSVDVYLVKAPWGWENIWYHGSTTDSAYTFYGVAPGAYAAFTVARPNSNQTQSQWTDLIVAGSEPAVEQGHRGYDLDSIDQYVGKTIIDAYYTYCKRESQPNYQPYQERYFNGGKQCVGYAWARLEEKLRVMTWYSGPYAKGIPSYAPNGETRQSGVWPNETYTIRVYTSPDDIRSHITADTLACFERTNNAGHAGHVIYVEEVTGSGDNKTVYYTEGGGGLTPGVLKRLPLDSFLTNYNSGNCRCTGIVVLEREQTPAPAAEPAADPAPESEPAPEPEPEPATYRVEYQANGGSGAPSVQTKTEGEALALSGAKPTRTGYTFICWNTKVDGSGVSYAPGSRYTTDRDVTLYAIWERVPVPMEPEREIVITSEGVHPDPNGGWAHYSTQAVELDGAQVVFQMYALKDEYGNDTNFVKVRDVAQLINGTKAQFSVDYDGDVLLVTRTGYVSNGSEMRTPFTGGRAYTIPKGITRVNSAITRMDMIQLTDDGGGGYTYYKLRDLGKVLGFNVGWTAQRGVYIETDKLYQE